MLSQGAMLLHPPDEVRLDERLRARSPRETERERSAFARETNVEVEERAAEPLGDHPFRHERDRRGVAWELEFVPVGQLLDAEPVLGERALEDVLSRPLGGAERRQVATERTFSDYLRPAVADDGRDDDEGENPCT
jgi:hypothetical protein